MFLILKERKDIFLIDLILNVMMFQILMMQSCSHAPQLYYKLKNSLPECFGM
jgi:hypothetical protein